MGRQKLGIFIEGECLGFGVVFGEIVSIQVCYMENMESNDLAHFRKEVIISLYVVL